MASARGVECRESGALPCKPMGCFPLLFVVAISALSAGRALAQHGVDRGAAEQQLD